MGRRNGIKTLNILTGLAYLVMIVTNALANILPINGITTGEVSDSYPNLFAPSGVTFSIWGVIYLLLAIYTVYQFRYSRGYNSSESRIINRINLLFIISSVANSLWIVCWHNFKIGLSVVLMLVILLSLIAIVLTIKNSTMAQKDLLFVKIPFSVYFGWISVATIANITALLVDVGWGRFGLSETIWTIIVLVVGLIIGGTTIWRLQDKSYGLVFVWAYLGIIIKHISDVGFNGEYPEIIAAAGLSVGIFISIIVLTMKRNKFIF